MLHKGYEIVAAITLLAVSLTGCSPTDEPADPDPAPDADLTITTETHDHSDHGHSNGQSDPPEFNDPIDEEDDLNQAAETARNALGAFLQTDRSYESWWDDFSQNLSAEARYMYETVDPANIPNADVNGEATIIAQDASRVTVQVPTTTGDWLIELVTEDDHAAWVVHQMTPPDPDASPASP